MQEPGSATGSWRYPIPPKRRRLERTVYSAEQRQELEKFFEGNHYPTYQDRETLAARLSLRENQVLVWFKNRRAKHARLLGLTRQQGGGAGAAPQSPGVCAPAPAPAPAGPVLSEGPVYPGGSVFPRCPEFSGYPVFSKGPGFPSPPLPSPSGDFPVAEPSVPSHSQAWWEPTQGAQDMVQAAPASAPAPAPAPAPVWPNP